MALFDTHAHLQDRAFAIDAAAVFERARLAGVAGLTLCGYDPESNIQGLQLAERFAIAFPSVGIHPHDAKDVTPASLLELESLAALAEVVAIGEIGLDFYRDHSPHDVQRAVLDAQLEIAVRTAKPVCLHTRGAEDAIYEHLAAYAEASPLAVLGRSVGVMHCFGGTLAQAQRFVALGFVVSLACVVTYPKNENARAIAAGLPLESLVIETDSPYLPPQHERGKRNEPANVRFAAEAIAAIRGTSISRISDATTGNACRLFGVRVAEGAAV